MKRGERTKTFMIISNWKKPWSPWLIQKYFSVERVKSGQPSWLMVICPVINQAGSDYALILGQHWPSIRPSLDSRLVSLSQLGSPSQVLWRYQFTDSSCWNKCVTVHGQYTVRPMVHPESEIKSLASSFTAVLLVSLLFYSGPDNSPKS